MIGLFFYKATGSNFALAYYLTGLAIFCLCILFLYKETYKIIYLKVLFMSKFTTEFEVPGGHNACINAFLLCSLFRSINRKMVTSGINLTIFFIILIFTRKKEYELRKNENIRFAEKLGIDFIDADYDVQNWFARPKVWSMSQSGELDVVCVLICFIRTALYAYENNFKVITSSLGISRWKDMEQINESELKQHLITRELLIGHITGAKMEEVQGCMKLLKRKNFINKNIGMHILLT